MFENHLSELLKMIHYRLHSYHFKNLVVEDMEQDIDKPIYDMVELPCDFLSDDKLRKLVCEVDETGEYAQVHSMSIDDSIHSMKASSRLNSEEDSFHLDFEKGESLYDIVIQNQNQEESCGYRMMKIINGKPFVTSVLATPSLIDVSRGNVDHKERIIMNVIDGVGKVQIMKNQEIVDEFSVDTPQEYYSAILSTVNHIINGGNQVMSEYSDSLFPFLEEKYSFLKEFMKYSDQSYDADVLDDVLRNNHIFVEDEFVSSSVK